MITPLFTKKPDLKKLFAMLSAKIGSADGWSYEGSKLYTNGERHHYFQHSCGFDAKTGLCRHGVHENNTTEIIKVKS